MGLLEIVSSPERRAEAKRQQDDLRARLGPRLAQHPAQANHLFGMAREQQALDQLQAIEDGTLGVTNEKRAELLNQLAEGMALQSRFEEAAAITESQPHKAEYVAKAEALKHVGIDCQCPPTVTKSSPADAKGITEETKQRVEEVFDGSAVITLTKCMLCGTFGARIG